MVNKRLPSLTEAQVRALATAKVFERGRDYFAESAISETTRQGMTLSGQCQGSDPEPYVVRVSFDKKGVADADCDCPYEYEGVCKHLVALLLTYIHEPQRFGTGAPSSSSSLADHSKEELLALINELTGRDPKLKAVVEINAAAHHARQGKPIDTAALRKQARRILHLGEWEYRAGRKIAKDLSALGHVGEKLRAAGDFGNAGAVYHALLDESVKAYDDLMWQVDENGDLAVVVDNFAEALGDCLKKCGTKNKVRQDWLGCLLDALFRDREMGGVDFASSADEIILEEATNEEWRRIEERVRAKAEQSRDWERSSLVEFLAAGLKRRKRQNEAASLVRDLGTPEQQARLLIREKQIGEAVRLINEIVTDKPGLVEPFADELVQAGEKQVALEFVLARVQAGDGRRSEWLAAYYRKHGSAKEALDWQRRSFLDSPSVERFKSLREVCRKTKNWDKVRAKVLSALEWEDQYSALLEIALYEGDVKRALQLLPRVKGHGWRDYSQMVGEAAEKDYPREAIKIYRQKAEAAIEERNRASYQRAADYLKRVKRLFQRLDDLDGWSAYVGLLRETYKHLPALQDEMRKASL
jgi:uncharacterized Zn finger protein